MMTKLSDAIHNGQWTWPHDWFLKYPILTTINVPTIRTNSLDSMEWRYLDITKPCTVTNVWDNIRPRGDEISWCEVVWSPQCIPRHAFHLWLVIERKLKTQDNLRQWDVWNHMKVYDGLPHVSASLNLIVDHLIPISKRCSARALVVYGSHLECQLRVVLFFPSPGVFPQGFPWEGCLRRQDQLASLTPDARLLDSLGNLCSIRWFFPIGAIVTVFR
ncbi:reverse transcriptase domain, reverse transcriptase zinc-binding domain protein [Tanacetum coccineum]|uniref:Reverse transcriptase domain, reverse transcriptase zinc-binding domain protein n=1 Tax=Tanacetum coccineum TaxID=301880 RepID=A0ABQ5HQN4_9ASTR